MTAKVNVNIHSFNTLFASAEFPLGLDSYQRPYVWTEAKIDQLLTDLTEFSQELQHGSGQYYMGSVLLHKDKEREKLFIIDGQQRLTTLSILHQVMQDELPDNNDLSYHSPHSFTNIRKAHSRLGGARLDKILPGIFDRICFTVIVVDRQDLAFTFFDTQNNRGIPLEPTDILKAHHLRAIRHEDVRERQAFQEHCATRWEFLQKPQEELQKGKDFAPFLFRNYLWRGRYWTGQRDRLHYEGYDDIIREFQGRASRASGNKAGVEGIPLFAVTANRAASHVYLTVSDTLEVEPGGLTSDLQAINLPLALRQPIQDGVGFFLYADKYNRLLRWLLNTATTDDELLRYRAFFNAVINPLSIYLKELYLLASLMYVDKFGTFELYRFALWLDYALGAVRMAKSYVFKEAPLIFLRDKPLNLLDVIAAAFEPEQVIEYLEADREAPAGYAEKNEPIETGKGVQGGYKKSVLTWYGQPHHLTMEKKAEWIREHLV